MAWRTKIITSGSALCQQPKSLEPKRRIRASARILVHHHRHAEVGAHHASPGVVVVLEGLVKGTVLDGGVDLLLVEDLLVALKLGIPADQQKVLLGIGEDVEGLSVAGDLLDVTLGQCLGSRDLSRGGRGEGDEPGCSEELLLLLQVRRAGRKEDHRHEDRVDPDRFWERRHGVF